MKQKFVMRFQTSCQKRYGVGGGAAETVNLFLQTSLLVHVYSILTPTLHILKEF